MDKEREMLKMAVVSGAAHALNFKEKNPHATDDDAIRHVTREMALILEKLSKTS